MCIKDSFVRESEEVERVEVIKQTDSIYISTLTFI